MKKAVFMVGLMVLSITMCVVSAYAEYPDKPITYIIPFNPGGESDITARLQEPVLEKMLGVAVNVTHKPGGGGAVGWSEFQRTAKPDGYSIIGVNIPHIIAQPILRKDAGFNFASASWNGLKESHLGLSELFSAGTASDAAVGNRPTTSSPLAHSRSAREAARDRRE